MAETTTAADALVLPPCHLDMSNTNANITSNSSPVSYTHLDVYKRQVLSMPCQFIRELWGRREDFWCFVPMDAGRELNGGEYQLNNHGRTLVWSKCPVLQSCWKLDSGTI